MKSSKNTGKISKYDLGNNKEDFQKVFAWQRPETTAKTIFLGLKTTPELQWA